MNEPLKKLLIDALSVKNLFSVFSVLIENGEILYNEGFLFGNFPNTDFEDEANLLMKQKQISGHAFAQGEFMDVTAVAWYVSSEPEYNSEGRTIVASTVELSHVEILNIYSDTYRQGSVIIERITTEQADEYNRMISEQENEAKLLASLPDTTDFDSEW